MLSESSSVSWFLPLLPNPCAPLRMFCFPYAGGGPDVFRDWAASLRPYVEILAAHLPGRGMRWMEPPISSLESILDGLADAIIPYLDRPYAFVGHSMGALLSFELARKLRLRGLREANWLFLSAFHAPQIPYQGRILHNLPEDEFLEELKRNNGTPSEVLQERELMELLMPTLRADFSVCERYSYHPEAPFNCPITVWGGLKDQDVSPEMLHAWHQQTSGPFKLRLFPGDHFFIRSAQAEILSELVSDLKSVISYQGETQ